MASLTETAIDWQALNERLESYSPREIIGWAHETFGSQLAMLSSMQKTASVLTHTLYAMGLTQVEIIFIDTGYHFPETLELRDRMIEQYGVNIQTYQPDKSPEEQFREYGRELYLRDRDYQLCCQLRKEEPYLKAARRYKAVLSGLLRSEGGARKQIPIVAVDPRIQGYKIHPLANWSGEQVDEYIQAHDVLVHPLHARGYPSIGCATCTTPVRVGEDERAGRWRHIREANPNKEVKLYCGINFSDKLKSKV
ncbi:MAG: phosphoadenylyl-sulfate reductase [bacterium]